jgi:hypothetical protein
MLKIRDRVTKEEIVNHSIDQHISSSLMLRDNTFFVFATWYKLYHFDLKDIKKPPVQLHNS